LELEGGIAQSVFEALRDKGHDVVRMPTVAGGMSAIHFLDDGTMEGAACWRADGTPIGLGGGLARPGVRFRPEAIRH
jgi:gamma-glutamyltranspeptidase/glutathione hydrolase